MAEARTGPDDVDLSPADRAEIDGMYLRLASSSYYELLGVQPGADRRTIRDAYFALSQRFHPDAWFGRTLGAWKPRMEEIFREVTRAYDVLSHKTHRADYDASKGFKPAAAGAVDTGTRNSAPAEPRATSGERAEPVVRAAAQFAPEEQRAAILPQGRSNPPPSMPRSSMSQSMPSPAVARSPIDAEAARRAARESLARKFARPGGAPLPGSTESAAHAVRGGQQVPQPDSTTAVPSSTLKSLEASRVARLDAERKAKLAHLVRQAEESLARNDLIGASNSLSVAATLDPDDAGLRVRADDMARKVAASLADKYVEGARQAERAGQWELAAEKWQKASAGRPGDAGMAERAANALLRHGKDLRKAAELARKATQINPKSVAAQVTLAEIFLKAGLRASALSAAEAASKLDPTSVVVKDFMTKLKG